MRAYLAFLLGLILMLAPAARADGKFGIFENLALKFYFEDDIDSDGDGLTDEEDDDDDNDGVEDSGDSSFNQVR